MDERESPLRAPIETGNEMFRIKLSDVHQTALITVRAPRSHAYLIYDGNDATVKESITLRNIKNQRISPLFRQ